MFFRLVFVFGLVVLVSGCVDQDTNFDFVGTELGRTRVDDLSRAIELAGNERQFEQRELQNNIQTSLNRWVSNSPAAVEKLEWQADPLWEPIQAPQDSVAVLKEMATLNFIDTDTNYLQEFAWLKTIIERWPKTSLSSIEFYRLAAGNFHPAETDTDPHAALFRKLHPSLDEAGAKQLANAHLMFDWIVRNVQLLPEVDHSQDDLEALRLNDQEDLAAAGVPGTGYQRFTYQTLIYGRGDYLDRAKLFILGLRVMGIDSIMLGVAGESKADEVIPWVVAVPIGGQYYLFDTQMGLAMPGETLGSTATLAELINKPALLEQLNLTVEESLEENTKYWIKPQQLNRLVGLIYVSPEAASKRFAFMQKNLTDAQRLPYSVAPSDLAKRLLPIEGVELKVWDIGVKTHQFRQAVREALEDQTNNELRERLSWYFSEEGYIDEFPRYRTGRVRFLFGQFENDKEGLKINAIDSFQNMMYSDEEIESLATDIILQERLGILEASKDSAEFQSRLQHVQGHMRLVRRDTGVFVAQSHFDNNSFGAANNWVKILRDKSDVDRWEDAINYLAGRSAESQKDYDSAIAEFQKYPKAIQAQGNIIRARLLKAAIKKVYAN